MGKFRQVDTGGRRNDLKLGVEVEERTLAYLEKLKHTPKGGVIFSEHELTAYGPMWDVLRVGTDVIPIRTDSDNPNDNITFEGVLVHELIGHREAALGKFTIVDNKAVRRGTGEFASRHLWA